MKCAGVLRAAQATRARGRRRDEGPRPGVVEGLRSDEVTEVTGVPYPLHRERSLVQEIEKSVTSVTSSLVEVDLGVGVPVEGEARRVERLRTGAALSDLDVIERRGGRRAARCQAAS